MFILPSSCASFPATADLRCKQKEAQVRLLESELQKQRHRRANAPKCVSEETSTPFPDTSSKECRVALSDITSKQRDLEECATEGLRKEKDAGSVEEGGRSISRSSAASISFLEDLEKEFKKQRSESGKAESLSAVEAGNHQHRTDQIQVTSFFFTSEFYVPFIVVNIAV